MLGPSAEEIVTPLVGAQLASYRDLPLSVFQIQTKFRDEARAKSGLLRGREFGMKDMYSFHATDEDFQAYYETVRAAYVRVFERCGLGEVTFFTHASGGDFSEFSHEFQAVTPYGEDTIYLDRAAGVAYNREIADRHDVTGLEEVRAIEVGNIFPLGARYTDAFGIGVPDSTGTRRSVVMGCYGIGTTRLLGAIAEIRSDAKGLSWPEEVAPYRWHVVPLSAAPEVATAAAELAAGLAGGVLLDDRDANAGVKLTDADLLGLPHRVIVSPRTLERGLVEYTCRATGETRLVDPADLPR